MQQLFFVWTGNWAASAPLTDLLEFTSSQKNDRHTTYGVKLKYILHTALFCLKQCQINFFFWLFYTLTSTFIHLNRLSTMPLIIFGPILIIECIKKDSHSLKFWIFSVKLQKLKLVGMGIFFLYIQ